MDILAIRNAQAAINFAVHGFDITVTPPGGDPVETRGMWAPPIDDGSGAFVAFRRAGPRRVLVIARTALDAVPKGSVIVAPEGLTAGPVTFVADQKGDPVDPYRFIVQLLVKDVSSDS